MVAVVSGRQQEACDKGGCGVGAPRMVAAGARRLQQVTYLGQDAIVSNTIGGGRGKHCGVRGDNRKEGK